MDRLHGERVGDDQVYVERFPAAGQAAGIRGGRRAAAVAADGSELFYLAPISR